MGMILRPDETMPVPRTVWLIVACDGDHPTLFGAPCATFDASTGDPRKPARDAGWVITADGPVYCPGCALLRRGGFL